MAGLTHLAVGIASKNIAPKMPVWILVLCAYLIDILFMIFMITGIEQLPLPDQVGTAPWSHSLFMAIIWSVLATLITSRFWHDSRTSVIIGLLVFSHWIIDFISQPMTFLFAYSASPLLHPFGGAPSIGLGAWSTGMGVILGEFGSLIIGIAIYFFTWRQIQNEQEIEKTGGLMTQMNLKNLKLYWSNISATRVVTSTLGILVGLAGIEHGILEVLQGNVTPNDMWIDAIGPGQRFWEHATETAITIIPNYFWTGILAIVIGLLVTIWATVFIERKYGARVLFLLSITLWLVGGGFAPIFFAIFATITATRINKPLTWWDTHLSIRVRSFLVKLWPWSVPVLVVIFWTGVEIAIFGYPLLWFFGADLTYGIQWVLGFIMLGLMLVSILSALAYEIQKQPDSQQAHTS
ncbi:MAG: hypothetical protein ACXAEU_16775 [Candidatus Hodarchaeales archaeon]|jgi:hypothetical protein